MDSHLSPKTSTSTESHSSIGNGASVNSQPQRRQARQPRTSLRPKRHRSAPRTVSDGSAANNEVIYLLQQQGDQELAAAKLKAKQQQQHQKSSPTAPASRNSQQNHAKSHNTSSSEPPKDGNGNVGADKPSAAASAATTTNPNTNHKATQLPQQHAQSQRRIVRPNQNTATHRIASVASRHAENNNSSSSPGPPNADIAAKERARAASPGIRQRQVGNSREQSSAPNMTDQQDKSAFLRDVILERARLEKSTSSSGTPRPLPLEESKDEEQAPPPAETTDHWAPIPEGSMPGAFRVGAFAPNETATASESTDNGSWLDGDGDGEDSWKEEPQDGGMDVVNQNINRNNEAMDVSEREMLEQGRDEAREPTHDNPYQGDFLVEATLVVMDDTVVQDPVVPIVSEPELVTAERLSNPYKPRDMLKSKSGRRWIIGGGCAFLITMIIIGVILGVVVGGRRSEMSTRLGAPPTSAPTPAPTAFEDLLPAHTIEAIKDASTPQAKAYQWYLDDMAYRASNSQLATFSSLQRFVLATFFYATGGDTSWSKASDWLKHDQSECDWFTSFFGSVCSAGPQIRRQLDKPNLRRHMQVTESPTRHHYNRLSLFENNLTGSIPPELSLLSFLDVLDPHTNSIGGTIPTELGLLNYVTLFQVYKNQLQGTVPSELGLLPRVKQLNLAFNSLSGTVPSELGQLSNTITSLSISNNRLTGSLPSEIGLLTKCEALYFYNNPNLTGPLPSDVGAMTALTKLQIDQSNLTGYLPATIGLLTGIETIILDGNRNLAGSIPESWGALSMLATLHLHNTNVSGKVPTGLCKLMALGTLKSVVVDCDKISCSPCGVEICDCSQSKNATSLPNMTNLSIVNNASSSDQDQDEDTALNPNSILPSEIGNSTLPLGSVDSLPPELVEVPAGVNGTPPPTEMVTPSPELVEVPPISMVTPSPELVEVPPGVYETPPPMEMVTPPSELVEVPPEVNGTPPPMEMVTPSPELVEVPPEVNGTPPPMEMVEPSPQVTELGEMPPEANGTSPPMENYTGAYSYTNLPIDNNSSSSNQGGRTELNPNVTLLSETVSPMESTSPPELVVLTVPSTLESSPEVYLPLPLEYSPGAYYDNITLPVDNNDSSSNPEEGTELNPNVTLTSERGYGEQWIEPGGLAEYPDQVDGIVTLAPTESPLPGTETAVSQYASTNSIFDHSSS